MADATRIFLRESCKNPADDHESENVFHEDQQRVMIAKFEVTSAPITAQKLEISAQTLSRSTLNFGG